MLEARRLGTSALRRLLGSVAYRDRLIVWIDDVQWGDVDSARLLTQILSPPDAPVMLFLGTYRSCFWPHASSCRRVHPRRIARRR